MTRRDHATSDGPRSTTPKVPARKGSPEPIAALNRVRILEYTARFIEREPLVDVRTHCRGVSLSELLCPYLRQRVADMLNAAQAALPDGHRLHVGTCLRTHTMQKAGWDKYSARMREEHPGWPLSTLRRAVNKYYAPYDQPAPPGHCTGGAVDVSIFGPDGTALDVLGPTKGWEAAYTWSDKIGDAAKANRMLMVEAMLGAGFSNCRDEYWHYSWGDSAWAVRTGVAECPYGWTHPPIDLDTGTEHGTAVIESVHTARDPDGRPLRADAVVRPEVTAPSSKLKVRFRVNWAKGTPITIRIPGALGKTARSLPELKYGDGGESWERIEEVSAEGDALVVRLTPKADRTVVSSTFRIKPGK